MAETPVRDPFVWFSDADNELVDFEPLCSHCLKVIPEEDVPLMLFRGEGAATEIARFHDDCFQALLERGVLPTPPRWGGLKT